LPEKLARSLVDEELPALDRPLRFVVLRGPRGAVRAASLAELQALLDRPWSPDEALQERPRRKVEHRTSRNREDRRRDRGRRNDRKRRRRR
jgi:tryptophan 2,3-dioxygenase